MYHLSPIGTEQLEQVLDIEHEALQCLDFPSQLRRNSPDMLAASLMPPHQAFGAFDGNQLVAFAVLFQPQKGDEEDLSQYLAPPACEMASANFKICIVKPDYRGHRLQQHLGKLITLEALRRNLNQLCATADPQNTASIRSLEAIGYRYCRTLTKYGFVRNLYYLDLDPLKS